MQTTIYNLVNSSEVFNTFINLKFRWEDEREYENFDDYAKVMIQAIKNETKKKNVNLIKGTKRPFGVSFEIDGLKFNLFLKTNNNSAWLACKKI